MERTTNNKNNKEPERAELQNLIAELSEINQKREKDLLELDRIAKLLVRRDLELTEMREGQMKELQEMDRIAKMLVRRDLALTETREKREEEFQQLQKKTQELEESRKALLNILEDVELARIEAVGERDKTLAIIENFPEGLLFFDKENKLVSANSKIRDFFGLSTEQLIGKSVENFKKLSSLQPLIEILGEKLKGVYRKEWVVREGLVLEVSTIAVMRNEEKVGVLVILRDVTREKLIERMKTEFVSIAAHQLRTPLSAVKWILRMILDGDLGPVSEGQRDFLEKTYQSNERMIKLVNDLLSVTRIEEGRFLYNVKPEDILQLTEKTITSLGEMARRKGLKFEYKKPTTKIPKISIDAEKVSLVIQNLVENAICYTKTGGVKVVVEFSKDKDTILFSVQDTGIGIPQEQQGRVFNRFFRSSAAIKTETEGTGLGLFIAKNVIEAHGGKIWFKSIENKGSAFFFTLPA